MCAVLKGSLLEGLTVQVSLCFSFQEYGSTGAAHADSEYERRMMAVYSRVLEEVEALNRKYTPVSHMASGVYFAKFLSLRRWIFS